MRPRIALAWSCTVFLFVSASWAADDVPAGEAAAASGVSERESDALGHACDEASPPPKWFFLFAAVNVYPRLESERFITKGWDPIMRLLAPGYDDVKTIGSLRDNGLLWPPHFGLGRVLSPRWAAFLQAGYSAGKVRTKADDRSVLLLPLHTDFEIRRGALYGGLCVDCFPVGMPELCPYDSLMARLRAAKPCLGARLVVTHATYAAKAKTGLRPLPDFFHGEFANSWLVSNLNLNVGADVPLDSKSALSFNAGYNFFNKRAYDFGGPAFTVAWKRFF